MSKGSKRRPTDEAAYADAYNRIFRKEDEAEQPSTQVDQQDIEHEQG